MWMKVAVILGCMLSIALGQDCAMVTRSQWGARPPTSTSNLSRPVPKVFIHHTAGSSCSTQADCSSQCRAIQNYHMDSNGWADIGYNFLIGGDGQAYEGRGWLYLGAHASNWNSQSIGISAIGTFTNSAPSSAMQSRSQALIRCGTSNGHISSSYQLHGHRDGGCTECPGLAYYRAICGWSVPTKPSCLSGNCGGCGC